MKTAQEIADFVEGALRGDGNAEIHTIGSLEHADRGALAYAEGKHLVSVASTSASCVLVPPGDYPGQTVIVVDTPRLAFATVAAWLVPQQLPAEGIHASAIVRDDVSLGDHISVGAATVIESGARIGRGSVIFPGCYVGRDCRIGEGCVVHPRVVLYAGVEIGDRVVLHAGVVVGADGFGFVFDGARHVKVPQVGAVTIGSDVEVGANTCIDRGALDGTVIGEGAKIDNLCQIAHNVKIGPHAIISSQTGIAGSSRVGRQATIGGQVGIADYCRIDDHAIVGAQCGVPSRKRVPAGQVYWGTPARPLPQIKKQQAYLGRLPKMAEELKRLRTEVEDLRSKLKD